MSTAHTAATILRISSSVPRLRGEKKHTISPAACQNPRRKNVHSYYRSGNENQINPFDQIPDPAANISRILFPDEADDPELPEKLCKAIEQLTDNQKDLIHELYGFCKSMTDVAREQAVTYEAIQNRRSKILRRLKKLIADQEI